MVLSTMRLTTTTFVTLDGVYQAPGGPTEDPSGGFEWGGWSFPYADEGFGNYMNGLFEHAEAFLLGRRTYDIFAAAWPKMDDPADPVGTKLNRLPKYVASTTLRSADWENSQVIEGDLEQAVRDLKARDGGELQVHGSGRLVQWLLERGLVDEVRLLTYPVILGQGMRLINPGAQPSKWKLLEHRTTDSGVAIHAYELAGAPDVGEFEVPE